MQTTAHTSETKYRARVEDHEGDRWNVIGPLDFLSRHCTEQRLLIVSIAPEAGAPPVGWRRAIQ